MPMHSLGHQDGTCKFGEDRKTSVLDLNCRSHDVDTLYVVDGSFFVSSGAVNPTLTIIANALRVGDHLLDRLNVAADERMRTSEPCSSRGHEAHSSPSTPDTCHLPDQSLATSAATPEMAETI